MPRKACFDLLFYVIITQVFPFSKDNADAYGEHLSLQRKCTCAEDNTRWILCTVIAMERRCVFLFPQCRNFLCCLVRSTFRKTFSVLWVKNETKQKTHLQERQTTSTHVITHSNVHNGTHGYDFSA